MHATIRQYSGSGTEELFDALEQREPEVRELISTVPGFVSYVAFGSGDGAGRRECGFPRTRPAKRVLTRRAGAWVAENINAFDRYPVGDAGRRVVAVFRAPPVPASHVA